MWINYSLWANLNMTLVKSYSGSSLGFFSRFLAIIKSTCNFSLLTHRLHSQNQDHWRCVQCLQQWACENQDPGEELHCSGGQHTVQAVVWSPLRHSTGLQERGKAGRLSFQLTINRWACVLLEMKFRRLSRRLLMRPCMHIAHKMTRAFPKTQAPMCHLYMVATMQIFRGACNCIDLWNTGNSSIEQSLTLFMQSKYCRHLLVS